MADTTALSDIDALLYEMRGPMQELYPKDHALLAEWHGVGQEDPSAGRVTPNANGSMPADNREIFSGNDVRIPLDLHFLEAGGWVAETGTVNEPIAPEFTKATVSLKKFVQPISITLEADEDSLSNSAVQATARLVAKARQALANHVNDAMNGNGDAILAAGAAHAGQSDGLDLILSAAVPDTLYVGKVVDVLEADGTDQGQGKRRKITAIDYSTKTLTFDTNATASDGGSGNLTLTGADVNVYVAGSFGNILQGGLTLAADQSGSSTAWQGVKRSDYPQFQAADGRNGDTATKPLTQSMIDAGIRYGERQGGFNWDFGIGDPDATNVFKAGFYAQMHYAPQTATLPSGFAGVSVDMNGKQVPLVPERKFKTGVVRFLRRDAATIYGRKAGPDFDRMTGSQWMRFNRRTDVEAWLVDRLEWGWHTPNTILNFEDLSVS